MSGIRFRVTGSPIAMKSTSVPKRLWTVRLLSSQTSERTPPEPRSSPARRRNCAIRFGSESTSPDRICCSLEGNLDVLACLGAGAQHRDRRLDEFLRQLGCSVLQIRLVDEEAAIAPRHRFHEAIAELDHSQELRAARDVADDEGRSRLLDVDVGQDRLAEVAVGVPDDELGG